MAKLDNFATRCQVVWKKQRGVEHVRLVYPKPWFNEWATEPWDYLGRSRLECYNEQLHKGEWVALNLLDDLDTFYRDREKEDEEDEEERKWVDMVDLYGVYDYDDFDYINYFGEIGDEYIEDCRVCFGGE